MLRDRQTGEWGFTIAPVAAGEEYDELEMVGVISVRELMSEHNIESIDVLKLDVEGGEFEVLNDATDWLKVCKLLIVELHERIRPGVTAVYERATKGRIEVHADGEKRLSVLPVRGADY